MASRLISDANTLHTMAANSRIKKKKATEITICRNKDVYFVEDDQSSMGNVLEVDKKESLPIV